MNDSELQPGDAESNREDAIQEELVAYLDGELDSLAAAGVERRLAEDEQYRRNLQSLERAWDLLDLLPPAEVGRSFAKTTVEMVAVTAADDMTDKSSRPRRLAGTIIAGAALLVAALGSFWLAMTIFSRSNDQLVKDLPVIENVDSYNSVESLEFLEMLDHEGLFLQEEVQEEDHAM